MAKKSTKKGGAKGKTTASKSKTTPKGSTTAKPNKKAAEEPIIDGLEALKGIMNNTPTEKTTKTAKKGLTFTEMKEQAIKRKTEFAEKMYNS